MTTYALADRYRAETGEVFMTGIDALARLPLEQLRADRRHQLNTAAFVSGYQGSPLGGYGDAVKRALRIEPDLPVVYSPGMNEEYAATAVMGSQLASIRPDARYDGVVGIWYGKAPGVDRAADALRHAVFAGTSMHGGAVAIVGDDPAAKSSTIPSSSAGLLNDLHMPVLYPGDPAEALLLGRHAIALSRATGLWTSLKIVADVADATATVTLDPAGFDPQLPLVDGAPYHHRPDGRLLTPHTIELEREIVEVRYELARRYAIDNHLNTVVVDPADAWIGLVASGITYREVREALTRLGLDDDADIAGAGIRLLKMGMPMPFEPATVRNFASGLEQIFVIEEKSPNLESLIRDALYSVAERPLIIGRRDEADQPLVPAWGALDADTLVPIIRQRLTRVGDRLAPTEPERDRVLIPVGVDRTPFFCSGCPHNRSTEVPAGSMVGAGIGCHTMVLLMDPERIGDIAGITCMGNEGTQWIGMSPFVDTPHLVQNLGDGTYFHSGQLAITAAIAAGVNVTYKLLYNGTVAMTGGQDPQGQLSVGDVAANLLRQGVARIIITTDDTARYRGELPGEVEVWARERLLQAQTELAGVPGVTVLIHDQACAAEARRARKRGLIETPNQRVVINPRICEGCGDCGQVSNCLSVQPIETFFGRKTHIDQTTCNLDYSCLEGDCPAFMTVTSDPPRYARLLHRVFGHSPASDGQETGATAPVIAIPPPPSTPAPAPLVNTEDFALRITGIGGTGVVTVSQVLGTAAMLDGYEVRGLDQIGLSQKAGPVVSDLRVSRHGAAHTNRLGLGQADLLLAFDQLVAASDKGLDTCSRERTVVVGSSTQTPTGAMVTHPDIAMPSPDSMAARIAAQTRPLAWWADAQAITNDLFGSSVTANLFVVGMAVQAGALPIDPARIEEAIELNGVSVSSNTAAFRWGRVQVHDPEAVEAACAHLASDSSPAPGEQRYSDRLDNLRVVGSLRADIDRYASELAAWGSRRDVDAYFTALKRVEVTEATLGTDGRPLLAAVAAYLFKLMAYKDEYEVARLMTDSDGMAEAHELAEGTGEISWKLHPPMLRALGLDQKIEIGSWATPMVRRLASGKRLRGTVADPFRWAEVRQVERALPGEYLAAIDEVLAHLRPDNIDAAVAIAELPDLVRGYEDIKLANVERYRTALASHLASFAVT